MFSDNQKSIFSQPTTIFVLICLIYLLLLTHNITLPWLGGHLGHQGKEHALHAKNFLRYGYWNCNLAPTRNYGSSIPQQFDYYLTHPILTCLVTSFFVKIFGITEWAARLSSITFSLASLVVVFYLVKKTWGDVAGLFSAFFWAMFPMTTYFGQLVCFEPQTCFFTIFSVYLYWEWIKSNERKYLWCLILIYLFAMLSDWPAYFLALLLGIHYFLYHRKPKSSFAFPILFSLYPVIIFGLFNIYRYMVTGNIMQSHGVSHQFRAIDIYGNPFTWQEFIGITRMRLLTLYTIPVCMLSSAWLILLVKKKLSSKKIDSQEALILVFLFLGLANALVFIGGTWHHAFCLFYLAPFFAIASGVLLGEIWQKLEKISISSRWVIIGVICFSAAIGGMIKFKKMHADHANDPQAWNAYKFALELARNIPEKQPFIFITEKKHSYRVSLLRFYYTDRPIVFATDQGELEKALYGTPNISYILVNKNAELAGYIKERFKCKLINGFILAYSPS